MNDLNLEAAPETTYLKDYTPPDFLIDTVRLHFDIQKGYTEVRATLAMRRNPEAARAAAPLILAGNELELISVAIDQQPLADNAYHASADELCITSPPEVFELDTVVRIDPDNNTQLEGLYKSKDGYFTQCEAEGFRRITYFLDRPDVMSRYTTVIDADASQFPLLLSNGNQQSSEQLADGRHRATWVDPFPKPSYLFALVAAELDTLESDFTTASGRTVKLMIFVEPGKLDQCDFALEALKAAMRWDEEVFGLELDLDQYMIVAVGDFNMGAMENKGLNIFNTKYVLARPDTATDYDFLMLDRVVAHEYFHNWTGNRVTCRDWFQLSLKEGLTVFRDQQYGGDRYSHAVQRIQEVRLLRQAQFPEDAGPMAHPVRPESYMEISNFYTATVYNKGAEVVRMIHTLLGAEKFRAGMDLYFARHDGQAVRTEEFVAAMEDASGIDLGQFKRWYSQAGTPEIRAAGDYDAGSKTYSLTVSQSCPATPDQAEKQPFHIPLDVGLLDQNGGVISFKLAGDNKPAAESRVLSFTESQQTFVFENVPSPPVVSLLRGFSAPVSLKFDYSSRELALLAAYDSDAFNRWEAGQRLSLNVLLDAVSACQRHEVPVFDEAIVEVFSEILNQAEHDPAFAAEALALPSASFIAENMAEVDPDAIHKARDALRHHLASTLEAEFASIYMQYTVPGEYSPDPVSAGRRSLRNAALSYLMELDKQTMQQRCLDQLTQADNMTDAMAALAALANTDCAERNTALAWFYERWQNEPLVLDKWFAVQASSRLEGALDEVKALLDHPAFELKNPNKVRALIGAFCHGNFRHFNAADGSGYAFGAEFVIKLDAINAQIAARLARSFDRWRKFDGGRQAQAEQALVRIRDTAGLSKDTYEVVSRALA